jgi:Type III restriction enzyme, res subunit
MNENAIKVRHTSIVVPNYEQGDNQKIEDMLSVWNDVYFRMDTIGFHYNEEKKELMLPRGLDINYLERQFNRPLEVSYKPDPHAPASFQLKTEPRSDIQRKSISFLLGEGDFGYTKTRSQLTLNLDTGDGKTYCVIAALTFMKTKSMIITHTDNIKNQWKNSLIKMTNIDEKYIFNIDGSSTIKKIMKLDKLPYKVYLVNHRTIHSYAKKHGWEAVGELFKKIEIGVKVFDEAHLEFENLMKTDLHTSTKKTFYLTANFERSQFKENRVFNLCFKNIARYGIETKGEKRKHIIYVPIMFNSKPGLEDRGGMRGRKGWFDKNKYSDYLINERPMFFDLLKWVLGFVEGKFDGKILLMLSKINATEAAYEFIKESFPDKTVGVYNSQIGDEEKEKSLMADIISSTPKSMGTGTDVPGLRCVINAEPYTSAIMANQASGRLREYGEDKYTLYIELIDTGFPDVVKMYKKRLPIFKKKCHKILELKYDQ